MSTSSSREQVSVPGPTGLLEAVVEVPARLKRRAFGIICHPHPLYGGSLSNKVVYTIARAFEESGIPAIRFNFRGVGSSQGSYGEGIGETEDTLAIVGYGRERWPGAAVWLGGFSFGAAVALRAAVNSNPALIVAVAPAISRLDLTGTAMPLCPWLIVQGDADELVSAQEVIAWSQRLPHPPKLVVLSGAGHFFHGRLQELRSAITSFIKDFGND